MVKAVTKAHFGRPIEWNKPRIDRLTQALNDWIENPKNYFVLGFCNEQGIDHKLLETLSGRDEDFRQAYSRAKQIQEERLVELGVSRKGDGNFIKFILANKAGYKDKQEISGDSSNPLALVLDKVAKQNQPEPIEAQIVEPESITNQSVVQSADNHTPE